MSSRNPERNKFRNAQEAELGSPARVGEMVEIEGESFQVVSVRNSGEFGGGTISSGEVKDRGTKVVVVPMSRPDLH